jgi:hypothetical protein
MDSADYKIACAAYSRVDRKQTRLAPEG